jgi:hypothetical protein
VPSRGSWEATVDAGSVGSQQARMERARKKRINSHHGLRSQEERILILRTL